MPFLPVCHAQGSDSHKLNTVCIDAGHGGKDGGCTRKNKSGKTLKEKDITLYIAKELGRLINASYPEVSVVLTRGTDDYVSLAKRGEIANTANADLFISIHIDAHTKKDARGFSIHCLGQSRDKNRDLYENNKRICQRENEVFSSEDDKPVGFDPNDPMSNMVFSLMQNVHLEQSLTFAEDVQREMKKGPIGVDKGVWQNPFMVLWVTSMPSVLIECGFLSNESDFKVFNSDEGKDKIAASIFRAFKTYKTRFDGVETALPVKEKEKVEKVEKVKEEDKAAPQEQKAEEKPAEKVDKVEKAGEQGTVYGTQIMAVGKLLKANDPEFKGYKPTIVKSGNLYKYIIGTEADLKKAREKHKKIKKTFPKSFLVKTDGKTVEIVR